MTIEPVIKLGKSIADRETLQPRTQGLSLGRTLGSAGHVIPRIWDFLNKNI